MKKYTFLVFLCTMINLTNVKKLRQLDFLEFYIPCNYTKCIIILISTFIMEKPKHKRSLRFPLQK